MSGAVKALPARWYLMLGKVRFLWDTAQSRSASQIFGCATIEKPYVIHSWLAGRFEEKHISFELSACELQPVVFQNLFEDVGIHIIIDVPRIRDLDLFL